VENVELKKDLNYKGIMGGVMDNRIPTVVHSRIIPNTHRSGKYVYIFVHILNYSTAKNIHNNLYKK
jgi:hypothetical protein